MAAKDPKTVLVLDDDPEIRFFLAMALGEEGYNVRCAANGLEGMTAVADDMPDLVVLDMMMPVMNGREFARIFRAKYGLRVPIVVLSAGDLDRKFASEIRAAKCMAKPFDLGVLLGVVAEQAA